MRRHRSYANVTATLALVLALSGTAIAASRYIITSPSQIKPSVLKKLAGAAGPRGPAGLAGTDGTNGTSGSNGSNGSNGATGPAGSTGATGPGFARTVIVSPAGTATQNGTALIAAMNTITAGISNPAVLLIEPGVYDLGTATLNGKADVDIEGSGQDVTYVEGLATAGNCVVDQAGGTELRSLSIDDGTADPCALDITGGRRPFKTSQQPLRAAPAPTSKRSRRPAARRSSTQPRRRRPAAASRTRSPTSAAAPAR